MKRSRAWRRRQTNRVIQNRLKFAKEYGAKVDEDAPHSLAKRHPLDCGCAKCKLCHSGKYYQNRNSKDYHYLKDHPEDDELYDLVYDDEYIRVSRSWD